MERRLTTILAADVVGYGRLMGQDEVGTLSALKGLREELIKPKETQYHGRTVKLMGDGTLMEFASVVDAVSFAVEVQLAMAERNEPLPEERRVVFRIGINIGDIIVDGDDIYGDGVNVAARLEQLCEPGGVCVSRNVYNQVKAKLDLTFEHLGEKAVKNIADPVTIYRVLFDDKAKALVTPLITTPAAKSLRGVRTLAAALVIGLLAIAGLLWWQPWVRSVKPPVSEQAAQPLFENPSIAVLPFKNLSDDPDQAYFVDGITADLITDLSKFPSLRVASRSSMAAYEEKSTDIRQVGRDLGVEYIVEGSVERAPDRIRVTAQLIEVATGTQLWAQRFDRDLADLFVVRDEIRAAIVGALTGYTGPLSKAEQARASRKSPDQLTARDLYYRAYVEFSKFDETANEQARILLEKSIALDPDAIDPHWLLAWVYWRKSWVYWSEDKVKAAQSALQKARRAVELDRSDYRAHWVLGAALRLQGDEDAAMAAYNRAFELNPNDPDMLADWGEFLSYSGQPEKAAAQVERAIALNPSFPDWYINVLGRAYYNARQYEKAIQASKGLTKVGAGAREVLAASYAQLGQGDKAKAEVEQILKLRPNYTMDTFIADNSPMEQELLEHFIEGLRKAGVPEG